MEAPAAERSYVHHVAELEQRLERDEAMRAAVGGEFVAIGQLESQLLRACGLRDGHTVIDVGCGSGRLACQLAVLPRLRYLGTDVVPRLLEYARELCARPDWRFEIARGTTIPAADGEADLVCFFSVFTHLSHEDVFRYLREARRVLKPGGRVVFSFLEFGIPGHWETFAAAVNGTRGNMHHNQFFGPDAIRAWAEHADLRVEAIHSGLSQYIPLSAPVRYDNGTVVSGNGSLGQSVAVLEKPVACDRPPRAAPLRNVAVRGFVRAGEALHAGLQVGGDVPVRLLVRAVGPTLARFKVASWLTRPVVAVHGSDGLRSELRGGSDDPEVTALFPVVGAFPLVCGEDEVAASLLLPPGAYTLLAKSADPTAEGEVLLEAYYVS